MKKQLEKLQVRLIEFFSNGWKFYDILKIMSISRVKVINFHF
jgi:hypothetical protein